MYIRRRYKTRALPDKGQPVEEMQVYSKTHIYTDGLSYEGDTSTHAQGTDPNVALGA